MVELQEQQGKKKRKKLPLIIMIICIAIMLICAGIIIKILLDYHKMDVEFEDLRSRTSRDIRALQELNPDTVGWVYVSDSRIDYPVMYTPNDVEYYLRRNFNKEYSYGGTPFVGEGSVVPGGKSTLIYGHNMRNGSMFADLTKFEDADFFNSHTISFTTIAGEGTYKPIAVFRVDLTKRSYFRYWDNTGNISEQQYNEFVSRAIESSEINTDVEIDYSHELLTLSTCSYGSSDERCVVLAMRIDQ